MLQIESKFNLCSEEFQYNCDVMQCIVDDLCEKVVVIVEGGGQVVCEKYVVCGKLLLCDWV